MRPMTNEEFAASVQKIAERAEPFRPQVAYIPEGDCLEFMVAPDDYYAERIDGLVTVFYSRKTGEIIGSLIKGVKEFCRRIAERCPGFEIEIQAGKVKLSHLFLVGLWTEPRQAGGVVVRTYRKLIEVAEKADATAELQVA